MISTKTAGILLGAGLLFGCTRNAAPPQQPQQPQPVPYDTPGQTSEAEPYQTPTSHGPGGTTKYPDTGMRSQSPDNQAAPGNQATPSQATPSQATPPQPGEAEHDDDDEMGSDVPPQYQPTKPKCCSPQQQQNGSDDAPAWRADRPDPQVPQPSPVQPPPE
jgi:hypothetical protein